MCNLKKLYRELTFAGVILGASLGLGATAAFAQDQRAPLGEQPEPTGAASAAMTTPAMSAPLVANPNPMSLDAGFLGPVYVTGAVSGLGLWQNNKDPDQLQSLASLSNGQYSFKKPMACSNIFLMLAPIHFHG